jgi:hypothetical protein
MSDIKKLLTIIDKVEKSVSLNESASLSIKSKIITNENDISSLFSEVSRLSSPSAVTKEMITQKNPPKSMMQTIADVGRYAESAANEYSKKVNEWETDPAHDDAMRDEALQSSIEIALKKLGMDSSIMYGKMSDDEAIELSQKISQASGTNPMGGPALDADEVYSWFEKQNMEEWSNSPAPSYGDVDDITMNVAGGLNKPHKQFRKEYPGDNPMAVKEQLLKDYKKFLSN